MERVYMKNKFLSFALIISIILSLFTAFGVVNASAEMPVHIKSVDCDYLDSKVTAEVTFKSVTQDGIVFLALYDGEKFITANQEEIAVGDTTKNIEITGADESYKGYDAKIICFGKDGLAPISTVLGLKVGDHFEDNSENEEMGREIAAKLQAVSNKIIQCTDRNSPELNIELYTIFTGAERAVLTKVKYCIDKALLLPAHMLTADVIKVNCESEIEAAKAEYDKMTKEAKEAFKGKMPKAFDIDELEWIAKALGVDVSDIN